MPPVVTKSTLHLRKDPIYSKANMLFARVQIKNVVVHHPVVKQFTILPFCTISNIMFFATFQAKFSGDKLYSKSKEIYEYPK